MTKIDIAIAPDDNYAKHCGVVMASTISNAKEGTSINFYILDGGISEENKSALQHIGAGKSYTVNFIRIDKKDFEIFPPFSCFASMSYITVSTWYRLKVASLLPTSVKRVLYLDCDVIVRQPLDELFESDMEGCLMAGAIDNLWQRYSKTLGLPNSYRYFNAGVMLIDLEAWRAENVEGKLFTFLHEDPERLKLMDQNVLNICLYGRVKHLGIKWNFQYGVPFLEDTCYYLKEVRDEYVRANFDIGILHYMGPYKPWEKGIGGLHKYRMEYFKYLKLTPWKFTSEEEEAAYHKNAIGYRPLEFAKRLTRLLRHKPLLVFRKYYIGRIILEMEVIRRMWLGKCK